MHVPKAPDHTSARRPDHASVRAGLLRGYGLEAAAITPLTGGADAGAFAFTVRDSRGADHMLKIHGETFALASARAADYLRRGRGLRPVIAPLPTRDGELFFRHRESYWLLYEYIRGRDGFQAELAPGHWRCLGETLRAAHDAPLPDFLSKALPGEVACAPIIRRVEELLAHTPPDGADACERRLCACLAENARRILEIIRRVNSLRPLPDNSRAAFVLCHGDIHAGNVIIPDSGPDKAGPDAGPDSKQWAELFLVDWDSACLAPRERDLMFIGAGVGGTWNREEQAALFYEGYGPYSPDADLLCRYRLERILADIAELGDIALDTGRAPAAREQALVHMQSQFLPGNVVAMADKTYAGLRGAAPARRRGARRL